MPAVRPGCPVAGPVHVGVRDDLRRRGCAPFGEVLSRVRVRDQRSVVAPSDRAVQGGPDAFVALRADDDRWPTSRPASTASRSVSSNESGKVLRTNGSDPSRRSSSTYCQAGDSCGMASSECATQTTGTCRARALSTSTAMFATTWSRVVSVAHDVVLHIDDEQRGLRPSGERGHGVRTGIGSSHRAPRREWRRPTECRPCRRPREAGPAKVH